jgi:hypothetical protein
MYRLDTPQQLEHSAGLAAPFGLAIWKKVSSREALTAQYAHDRYGSSLKEHLSGPV